MGGSSTLGSGSGSGSGCGSGTGVAATVSLFRALDSSLSTRDPVLEGFLALLRFLSGPLTTFSSVRRGILVKLTSYKGRTSRQILVNHS